MTDDRISRRTFVRNTSLMAIGSLAAGFAGKALAAETVRKTADTSKILNYNPRMQYRRLGKTGLMVSEISLGGHWANRDGKRYWLTFDGEEAPRDVVKNRAEVVSRCIDRGINFADVTTTAECIAYGAALKGRRDKIYIAADDSGLAPREKGRTNTKDQIENVEACLRRLRTDYLDVWRPMFRQDGKHTDEHVEACVEAFEKAHAQGKIRWLGMTSHNRKFLQHVVENFRAYSVVYFPYTAKSKLKPSGIKSIDPKEIVEVGTGDGVYSGDVRRGIFDAVEKHDVGVVTIKPFAGGSLFDTRLRFGSKMGSTEEDYERARLTLAYILCNPAISATVPGMTTIEQVDNNARAAAERLALLNPKGLRKLDRATERMWANLPEEYGWLRDWEWV